MRRDMRNDLLVMWSGVRNINSFMTLLVSAAIIARRVDKNILAGQTDSLAIVICLAFLNYEY